MSATQTVTVCDFNQCDRVAVVATMTSAGNLHVVPMDSDPMDTDYSCEVHGAELLPWRHVGWVAEHYAPTHCAACGIPLTPQNKTRQHAGGFSCGHGPHD